MSNPQGDKKSRGAGEQTDDAMTIIAGLIEAGRRGDASRVALIWLLSLSVQSVLIYCVGVHTHFLWTEKKEGQCGKENAPLNCPIDTSTHVGLYFAVAGYFWYILQDQYATSVPIFQVLRKTGAYLWYPVALADSLVTWITFFIGVAWLSMTRDLQDIVLNCTALLFIAEIDDQAIKVWKRVGIAKDTLAKSAQYDVVDALQEEASKSELDEYKALGKLGCAAAVAQCSLPISSVFTAWCLWMFGQQEIGKVDWAVICSVSAITCCLTIIFVYDLSELDQNGTGALFTNDPDAYYGYNSATDGEVVDEEAAEDEDE